VDEGDTGVDSLTRLYNMEEHGGSVNTTIHGGLMG